MRSRIRSLPVAALGGLACFNAAAQFAATGGPSQAEGLLVGLPWIGVMAVLALGWFGPQRLRPILRRVSKNAFAAYFVIALTLFVSMLVLHEVYGPNTQPLVTVGVFFLMSVFLSGPLIAALMTVALAFFGAQIVLRRRCSRMSLREGS